MAIDPEKVTEALELCAQFIRASTTTLHSMQVFVGKLMHVSKCSPPARRFTNRVLDPLRAARQASPQAITDAARLDVTWFLAFLPLYNGVNLIKAETAHLVAQVDACTSGAGGICAGVGFFSFLFPESITCCQFAIASLECYNVLVACRMWMPSWRGLHVLLYSDNGAFVCSLNSGVAEDPLIRASGTRC